MTEPATEMEPITEIMLVCKALGHPCRIGILQALSKGLCCTSEILDALGNPALSSMRHHMALLVRMGIVEDERSGREQQYELNKERLWAHVNLITKWFRTL